MITVDNVKKTFQDKTFKRILKNSAIILSGNTVGSALNFVSFAIVARQLGPETLALFVLVQTYALIMNDLFNVQTWESMIKFGSKNLKSNNNIANIIKTNFILDLVSAIVAVALALLFITPIACFLDWDESYLNVFMLYSLSILFNLTTFTIGIPRLFNKFTSLAKTYVLMAILKLGCVLYAMCSTSTLISYVYIYLCIEVLQNLILIIYSLVLLRINCGRGWWKERFQIDRDQIRFIWWTNLRSIVRVPILHLDMFIINMVMPIRLVGVYKVYKEFAGLILRVGEPINQSVYPEYSKLIGNNEIKKTISLTKSTILLLLGVGTVITIILLFSSKFLIGTFFGAEYLLNLNELYLLIVVSIFGFVTVPINSLFIAAGFAKYSFVISLFINIIFLTAAYSLGTQYGLYGIILANVIQSFLNKGLKVFFLTKHPSGWGHIIR